MTRTLLTMTILGTVICLTGCMMQDTQGSPVATSEPTPVFGTSTPPFESGLTPTFAFTPTVPTTLPTAAEEISATPSFPLTESIDSLILSTGTSTTCALPCWHDLQIGVSTQDDVQVVLSELLDTEGEYDFFPPPPATEDRLLQRMRRVEDTDLGGYYWYTQAGERYGAYYLMSYIDESTGKLIGVQEYMRSYGSYDIPSLAEVVDHLGKPDWVYGSRGGSTYVVVLFYAKGIHAAVATGVIQQDLVCLETEPDVVHITLLEPYSLLNGANGSPLAQEWSRPEHPAPYIQEELGTSIDEFLEFIHTDNPCIEIPR